MLMVVVLLLLGCCCCWQCCCCFNVGAAGVGAVSVGVGVVDAAETLLRLC